MILSFHLRIRLSVLDSHDAISDGRSMRNCAVRSRQIRRGEFEFAAILYFLRHRGRRVAVIARLAFEWVWVCDPRRGVFCRTQAPSGRSEKEDAIDDRVRGRNHEIRARRVGPAAPEAEEGKRGEPEVPEPRRCQVQLVALSMQSWHKHERCFYGLPQRRLRQAYLKQIK